VLQFFVKASTKIGENCILRPIKKKSMQLKRIFCLLALTIVIWSCKNDDDATVPVVPPQSLAETIAEDDAEIKAYLQTHFYNYEEFASPPSDFDFKIKIDTIAGDNAGKTALADQVSAHIVTVSSADLGLELEEINVPHTMYYLAANEGGGMNPTPVDSVYLRYEGSLLNGSVFDSSTGSPVWFDLQGTLTQGNSGVIRGFKEGLPKFKEGSNIVENDDGTFVVEDFGVGLLIIPSGLAYFSGTQVGDSYSPIIFKVELLVSNTADHDRDGVPSYVEDLDGNKNPADDDTDEDGLPNYLDSDDDGDDISTRDEISDKTEDKNIIIPYPDTDGDTIPDYLDSDS